VCKELRLNQWEGFHYSIDKEKTNSMRMFGVLPKLAIKKSYKIRHKGRIIGLVWIDSEKFQVASRYEVFFDEVFLLGDRLWKPDRITEEKNEILLNESKKATAISDFRYKLTYQYYKFSPFHNADIDAHAKAFLRKHS
jgi:hypothetical protein